MSISDGKVNYIRSYTYGTPGDYKTCTIEVSVEKDQYSSQNWIITLQSIKIRDLSGDALGVSNVTIVVYNEQQQSFQFSFSTDPTSAIAECTETNVSYNKSYISTDYFTFELRINVTNYGTIRTSFTAKFLAKTDRNFQESENSNIPINTSRTYSIASGYGAYLKTVNLWNTNWLVEQYEYEGGTRPLNVMTISNENVIFSPTSAELYNKFKNTYSRFFYLGAYVYAPIIPDDTHSSGDELIGYAVKNVTITLPSAGTLSINTQNITTGNTRDVSIIDSNYIYQYEFTAFADSVSSRVLDYTKASTKEKWTVDFDTEKIARWTPRSDHAQITILVRAYMPEQYGHQYNNKVYVHIFNATITAYLDTEVVTPIINFGLSDVNDNTGNKTEYGKWLTLQSTINAQVGYTTIYGATLSDITVTTNGETFRTTSFNTQKLKDDFDGIIDVSITDSRGITATKQVTIPYYEWNFPSAIVDSYKRCLQDGTETDLGDYCKMIVSYNISSLENQNAKDISRVIPNPSGTGTITVESTLTNYVLTETYIFPANIERSYTLSVTVTDDFASDTKTIILSTAGVIMDFLRGGKGIGLGKVAEYSKMVDVNPEWRLRSEYISVRIRSGDGQQDLGILDLGTFLYQLKKRLDDGGL